MARDDLQYIDLADFSPGISTGYHSIGAGPMTQDADHPTVDGTAQVDGTYNCVSLPGGGLGPTPRWTIQRSAGYIPPDTHWPTDPGDPEVYDGRGVILDAKVISPVTHIPSLTTPVDPDLPPVDVYMVRQFWVRRDEGSQHPEQFWYLTNHLEYTGDVLDGEANYGLSALDPGEDLPPRDVDPSRWTYGGGSLTETRTVSPDVDPTSLGLPVVVAGMGGIRDVGGVVDADPEGLDVARYVTYPSYENTWTGTGGPYTEPADTNALLPNPFGIAMPGIVFGHQGRLMALARSSGLKFARRLNYHGNDNSFRAASELVLYWPTNDIYDAGGPIAATFMEESSSGYGTWCSVSANSLLLVKNQGGGVQVNGDIRNPSVVRLPGLPSVGGRANRGVMTERGYVYGTVSGVWIWTGSDTAEPASDALDPLFWIPDDPTIPLREVDALVGSFAYRHPYVFAPNNWMLDMRTGGWWRYAPTPDQYADGLIFGLNEVDSEGNLWAFPPSYVTPGVYCRMFDQNQPVNFYRWQSQPLSRSRNRYLTYRQVNIVAAGQGTVEVTVRGIDGTEQTVSVDIDSDRVVMVRKEIAITTTDVEVTIAATATLDEEPAPTVHRVSLGYRENQGVDRTGAIRDGA